MKNYGPTEEQKANAGLACCLEEKETCAAELLYMLQSLDDRLEAMVNQLGVKLTPVMREPSPSGSQGQVKQSRPFPPLFETIRERLCCMESTTTRILDYIHRLEL